MAENVNNKRIVDTDANLVANLIASKHGFSSDTFKHIANIEGTITKFGGEDNFLKLDGTVPMTGELDLNGLCVIIDADADSKICGNIDDVMRIELGGSEKFRFSTTGFGIGIIPTALFHVSGSLPATLIEDSAANRSIGAPILWVGTPADAGPGTNIGMFGIGDANDATKMGNIFRVEQDGKVSIGHDDPASELHVFSSNNPTIQVGTSGIDTGDKSTFMFFAGDGAGGNNNGFTLEYNKTAATDRLAFVDGGAIEGFTLANGGHAGFGQTAPVDAQVQIEITDATDAALQIKQSGAGDIFRVFDGAAETFTIEDGGKVAIASGGSSTTTANETLHLIAPSNGPKIQFDDGALVGMTIGIGGNGFEFDSSDTNSTDIIFKVETGLNIIGNNKAGGAATAVRSDFTGGDADLTNPGGAFTLAIYGGNNTGTGDGNGGVASLELLGGKSNTDDQNSTIRMGGRTANNYWEFRSEDLTGVSLALNLQGPGGSADHMFIYDLASVNIGGQTPVTDALLNLSSITSTLLIPRMTTTQKNALTATNGMIVYDSSLNKFQGYENGSWTSFI